MSEDLFTDEVSQEAEQFFVDNCNVEFSDIHVERQNTRGRSKLIVALGGELDDDVIQDLYQHAQYLFEQLSYVFPDVKMDSITFLTNDEQPELDFDDEPEDDDIDPLEDDDVLEDVLKEADDQYVPRGRPDFDLYATTDGEDPLDVIDTDSVELQYREEGLEILDGDEEELGNVPGYDDDETEYKPDQDDLEYFNADEEELDYNDDDE